MLLYPHLNSPKNCGRKMKNRSVSDINISLMTYDIVEEIMSLELFGNDEYEMAYNGAIRECIEIINKMKNDYMETPCSDVRPKSRE